MDSFESQVATNTGFYRLTAGTATGIVAVMAAGYTMWTLRGGYLLATFLSSLPAWRAFDPLPILCASRDDKEKRTRNNNPQDSLESILTQATRELPQNI